MYKQIVEKLENTIRNGTVEEYKKIIEEENKNIRYISNDDFDNFVVIAAENNRMDFINLFSEYGIENAGEAGEAAAKNGNMEIVDYLLNYEDGYIVISMAVAKYGDINMLKKMIDRGFNISDSILCGAAEGGHLSIVKYAIELGASDLGDAVTLAKESGNNDIVKYILDNYNDGKDFC